MIMKSYGLGVLFFRSFEGPVDIRLAESNAGSKFLETIEIPDSGVLYAMVPIQHELSLMEVRMAEDDDFIGLLHGVRKFGTKAFRDRFVFLIDGYMRLGYRKLRKIHIDDCIMLKENLEKQESMGHAWERIAGSNITYRCSKCGTLGTSPTLSYSEEWEPVSLKSDACEIVFTTAVMES